MLDKFASLVTLLREITWSRAVLWAFTALATIALYQVYETRGTTIPALFGNSLVLVMLGASVLLGTVSWAGSVLMRRIDTTRDELQSYMAGQIAELQGQVRESRHAEALARDELAQMRQRMAKAERILRQNGLDLDPSTQ